MLLPRPDVRDQDFLAQFLLLASNEAQHLAIVFDLDKHRQDWSVLLQRACASDPNLGHEGRAVPDREVRLLHNLSASGREERDCSNSGLCSGGRLLKWPCEL